MSAVVVVELTFDTVQLFAEDGTRWFRITKGHPGSPPVVRGRDVVIPHAAGMVARSRIASHLDIELEGRQLAPDGLALDDARAAFRTGVLELLDLFDGTGTPRTLSALLEDGSTATIDVRVIPPVLYDEGEREQGIAGEFSVAMRSVDPAWAIVAGS